MNRFLKRYQLWFVYAVFLLLAVLYGGREGFFSIQGEYAAGKVLVLLAYAAFLAYSIYSTQQENFFKSVMAINRLWWGRQIGADLYISVFLSLALVYLIEGSLTVTLLWAAPILFFANLAILPYLILNYSAVIGHFLN